MKKKLPKATSATKDPNWNKLVYVLSGEIIDPLDSAFISMLFDQVADDDEKEIVLIKKLTLLQRKVCWVKIISYPVELVLLKMFLGKAWSAERVDQNGVYRDFLKGDMTIQKFNTRMIDIESKYLKAKSE